MLIDHPPQFIGRQLGEPLAPSGLQRTIVYPMYSTVLWPSHQSARWRGCERTLELIPARRNLGSHAMSFPIVGLCVGALLSPGSATYVAVRQCRRPLAEASAARRVQRYQSEWRRRPSATANLVEL